MTKSTPTQTKPKRKRPKEELFDANPKCRHKIVAKWSGIKCAKCPGWFCY